MILDPAQYYNYTQPDGNHMPYMNYKQEPAAAALRLGQTAAKDIIETFHLPSGL